MLTRWSTMKNLYPWVRKIVSMAMKLINKIEISDITIIIALTLLGFAPLLLIQEQEIVADEMAKYAYYLIVVGIAWKALLLLTKQKTKRS
jgi:hypothetical protein